MISAEWVAGIKDGHMTKTVQIGNCTARIHRPILDEDERARREEQVRNAMRRLSAERKEQNHDEAN